jgi:hypothetical protein
MLQGPVPWRYGSRAAQRKCLEGRVSTRYTMGESRRHRPISSAGGIRVVTTRTLLARARATRQYHSRSEKSS